MRFRATDVTMAAVHNVSFDGFSVYESSGLDSCVVNFRDQTSGGQIYFALPLGAGEGATIFFPNKLNTKSVYVEVVGSGSVAGVLYSRVNAAGGTL